MMRWWGFVIVAGVVAVGAVAFVALSRGRKAQPLLAGQREEPIRETELASAKAAARGPLSSFVASAPKGGRGGDVDPIPWWEGGSGG